jgi:hypothetical protein
LGEPPAEQHRDHDQHDDDRALDVSIRRALLLGL